MQCILPQGQTTPERTLSNPWYGKGFCEPHQYKAALDRCEGGYESCDLFIDIFTARQKIERDYINELEKWAASSIKQVGHSKEFGSNKKAWIESIRASKEITAVHQKIADRLQEDVVGKMVAYKKEKYGKSLVHVKKIKEFEHAFEQAQKSWLKLLEKINKAKKEYQDAHRHWKKAQTAEKIIESDHGADENQKEQMKLSVNSYRKQSDAMKSKYQQYINEMQNTRPNYENAMRDILNRTHDFERQRLQQFKDSFIALQEALRIENESYSKKVSESFERAISSHDTEKDIQWWNSHYGSDTNTHWPSFESLEDK